MLLKLVRKISFPLPVKLLLLRLTLGKLNLPGRTTHHICGRCLSTENFKYRKPTREKFSLIANFVQKYQFNYYFESWVCLRRMHIDEFLACGVLKHHPSILIP